ncbi:putative allantoicase isoform X2 [Arapaima gigas]
MCEPDFVQFNNLACETAGGKVIFATDEWFAPAQNLLKREPAEFRASAFTEFGKWMDGWETRRKRIPGTALPFSSTDIYSASHHLMVYLSFEGHDWCIIQLGVPGVIHGFDVDTSFFTGNYTPSISIQASCLQTDEFPAAKPEGDHTGMAASEGEFKAVAKLRSELWEELVPVKELKPGNPDTCHNYFHVAFPHRVTHIRLNMYPDGGIARLRVYGVGQRDCATVSGLEQVDLVALANGGVCLGYSDAHFGHPRNMIGVGRAANMGDGWETARRLDRPQVLKMNAVGILEVPGSEWAVFRLGHPGVISLVEIDTNHFKGNYPDSCKIEACNLTTEEEQLCNRERWRNGEAVKWRMLLPPQKLKPHQRQFFSGNVLALTQVMSHVRLSIAPDGGVSRMRLWGRPKHFFNNPANEMDF